MLLPRHKAAKVYFISIFILILGYSLYYLHGKHEREASGLDDNNLKATESPIVSDNKSENERAVDGIGYVKEDSVIEDDSESDKGENDSESEGDSEESEEQSIQEFEVTEDFYDTIQQEDISEKIESDTCEEASSDKLLDDEDRVFDDVRNAEDTEERDIINPVPVIDVDPKGCPVGYSLLHNAAVTCSPEAIRSVVEDYPELVNGTTNDDQRKTAMVLVIESTCEADAQVRIECLKQLKGAGVDELSGSGAGNKYTALYAAIKKNEPDLIDYLISIGANSNMFHEGKPLLHHAIKYCTAETFPRVFKMFKEKGADLRVENDRNRMAIHEAAALNKDYAIKSISEYCDIDIRTPKYRRSKTHSDAELLQRKNMYGATAVHIAARFNSEAAYLQLKDLGAEMNKKDSFDKKPKFYNNNFSSI